MNSAYCRGCGTQIHATAAACPHCGALQSMALPVPPETPSVWMAWVGAGLCALVPFDVLAVEPPIDRDTFVGACFLAVIGIAFAGASLVQRRGGKGISIAAIVVGVIGLLISLGSFR